MRATLAPLLLAGAVSLGVGATPSAAAPLLVINRDGHVRTVDDRALPPAIDHQVRSAIADHPTPRARAARRGPSVRAELRRLETTGAIDAATATRYRATWSAAQRTLGRLHGLRRRELRAVLTNVDAIAAARLLTASRLPALMLTVQRNRSWWAAAPIPRAGARARFADSQLVWQYYPGQGLEIQWLGTFGRANGLWMMKTKDTELRAALDEALGLAARRAGGLAFEYLFRFDGGRPPWVSGLAQGTALSALSRGAVRLKDSTYFLAARDALGLFRTPPPSGVRVATGGGRSHYLQYSFAPRLRIVNGFVQSLNGLHDFTTLANDAEGRALFDAGEAELRRELPRFDTGAWSLYSRVSGGGGRGPGPESDLGYHTLLRDFLRGLCDRLEGDRLRAAPAPAATAPTGGTAAGASAPAAVSPADPAPYCQTAERFTADLTTPPALQVDDRPLRARRHEAVDFTLSKVSTVSVTVSRGGRTLVARRLRLGHGRHAVDFRTAQAGPVVVALRAVDLAGNVGATTTTLHVRPATTRH